MLKKREKIPRKYLIANFLECNCLQRGKFSGTTILSRVINRDNRKLKFDDSEDEEEEATLADPNDVYAMRRERDFKPVPGMDGMFYKVASSLTLCHLL